MLATILLTRCRVRQCTSSNIKKLQKEQQKLHQSIHFLQQPHTKTNENSTQKGLGPGIKPVTFMLWGDRADPCWTIWNSQLQIPTPKVNSNFHCIYYSTTTETAISRKGTWTMFQDGLDCLNKADILTDIHSKTGIGKCLIWKNYILLHWHSWLYYVINYLVKYQLSWLLLHFWYIKTSAK